MPIQCSWGAGGEEVDVVPSVLLGVTVVDVDGGGRTAVVSDPSAVHEVLTSATSRRVATKCLFT